MNECLASEQMSTFDTDDVLNTISKEIKKANKSLRNRLQSISFDNKLFVDEVVKVFPHYPVVPNARCGLWYCRPYQYEQTSYFKSTDGHSSIWDFSIRRLNFHLLPTLAKCNGMIIVDSTRRGKSMPDSFSKTIPIWCAVLNSLIVEYMNINNMQVLFCPPDTVSCIEYDQIKAKLPRHVEKLKSMDVISGQKLFELFGGRILRPFWVYPNSSILNISKDVFTGEPTGNIWKCKADTVPIVLYTASYQSQDGADKRNGFTYVQGAADDHELWANGLTPKLFWKYSEKLTDPNVPEADLLSFCHEIVALEQKRPELSFSSIDTAFQITNITDTLSLGSVVDNAKITDSISNQLKERFSLTIICCETVSFATKTICSHIEVYPMNSDSKKSSRMLRTVLIEINALIDQNINSKLPILICCNTGKDISVGILLTALCQNYDLEWTFAKQNSMSKTIIKKQLAKIINYMPAHNLNPSRATLNSINAFLIQ